MPLISVSTISVRVIVSTRLSNLMSVDLACEHEMHLRDKEEFTSFTVAFWLVQFHGSGSFLHEIGLVQRPRHSTHFSVFSLPFAQQLSQAEQARQRVCTQIVRGITRSALDEH